MEVSRGSPYVGGNYTEATDASIYFSDIVVVATSIFALIQANSLDRHYPLLADLIRVTVGVTVLVWLFKRLFPNNEEKNGSSNHSLSIDVPVAPHVVDVEPIPVYRRVWRRVYQAPVYIYRQAQKINPAPLFNTFSQSSTPHQPNQRRFHQSGTQQQRPPVVQQAPANPPSRPIIIPASNYPNPPVYSPPVVQQAPANPPSRPIVVPASNYPNPPVYSPPVVQQAPANPPSRPVVVSAPAYSPAPVYQTSTPAIRPNPVSSSPKINPSKP